MKNEITMAIPLQKSAATSKSNECHPALMQRNNSQIRIVLKTLGPSIAPTNFNSSLQNNNDSAAFDSSWEQKPLLAKTPKNTCNIFGQKHCNECQFGNENKLFFLRSFCRCEKLQRKLNVENVNETPTAERARRNIIDQSKKSRLRIPFSDYLIQNSPVFRKKLLQNSSVDTELGKPTNDKPVQNAIAELSAPPVNTTMRIIYRDEMFEPRLTTCSTPKVGSSCLGNAGKQILNLQTRPSDLRFIDSDNESSVGIDDKLPDIGLVKCFSLTRNSCRSLTSTITNFTRSPSMPNSPMRTSIGWPSFNTKKKPLQESPLKRQKNIKLSKKIDTKAHLSSRKLMNQSTDKFDVITNEHDENVENLGCQPLLTKDNIEHQLSKYDEFETDQIINWGAHFEYSFICEPSTSDTEDAENGTDTRPKKMSWEFPTVTKSPMTVQEKVHALLSPMRRSISNPSFVYSKHIGVRQPPNKNRFIKIDRDDDDHVTIHQATVISLSTLSVSAKLSCSIFIIAIPLDRIGNPTFNITLFILDSEF